LRDRRGRGGRRWPGVCIDTLATRQRDDLGVFDGAGPRRRVGLFLRTLEPPGGLGRALVASPRVDLQGFGAASSRGVSSSDGSHQVRNASCVISSAPVSARTRPAPPK
jgi:hypothetical protein